VPTTDLKERTKSFALRVLNLVDALPKTDKGRAIARQIVKSGTSVGANYRAACRARSKAEFVSKVGTVVEEADETAFWLELIIDASILSKKRTFALWQEANELVAIMTTSRKTAELSIKQRVPDR